MNHPEGRRSRKAGKGLLGGLLLVAVALAWGEVGASEKYGMPSENETHRQGYTGTGASAEAVVWVKALREQEDRLFVNGEPYVLEGRTRFEDERGAKIGLEDIPPGSQIEMEYRMGSGLEESGYGPDTRILTRIRLLQPPPRKKRVP